MTSREVLTAGPIFRGPGLPLFEMLALKTAGLSMQSRI